MAEQTETTSLLREIDDELRHERYKKLWQKYGVYLVAFAAALVAGVAGYQGWRSYDLNLRREAGERLEKAKELASREEREAARAQLAALARDARPGYAMLARFQEAALLARAGDHAGAAALYRSIAEGSGADSLYRDLAMLLGAMHEARVADPALLIERLKPLTAPDNPWRHSARELQAALAGLVGDRERARELLANLTQDVQAPEGLRQRAEEMLAVLEGK